MSQLISAIERSANQQISEEDFTKVWIDMETGLRDKIDRNQEEIRKCQLAVTENVR